MAVINGTTSAEALTGAAEADVIYGYAGNDTLSGLAGNDELLGGAGADSIDGGTGNDTIDGGAGTIVTPAELTAYIGTTTDNSLDGDTLGDGADSLLGGDGDDTFIITASELTSTIYTAQASATTTTANTLYDYTFTASVYADTIDGGAGTDTLEAELNANDFISFNGSTSTISGVAGVTINNIEQIKVTNLGDYVLDLSENAAFGSSDVSLVSDDGGAANSSAITALTYTVSATSGAIANFAAVEATGIKIGDTYYFGNGQATSYETENGGTVTATYSIPASAWVLSYTPAAADAYQVGDASVDTDDIADETLTITITDALDNTVTLDVALSANYDKDIDASGATAGLTLTGDAQANDIIGSDYDDVIWAGATAANEADTINAGAGNDVLAGKGGADVLNGEEGNDTVFGGEGADNIDGGSGDDMIWAGDDADINVTGGAGNDIIGGGDGADNLLGGSGDDVIYAGSDDANDTIGGDAGADTIYGGAGNDSLLGGDGDDLIFNGAGADVVNGGAGADTIWGGAGNDTLEGEAGNDVFAFAAGNGSDVIVDFDVSSATVGEGDVLDLSAFGFTDTADVLESAYAASTTATSIYIAPGQTITLSGVSLTTLQGATDDWVIV